MPIILQADDGKILDRKITITKNKETVYKLLKQISDQTGYLFIYDSQLVDNDKKVKIRKGEYAVREAIYAIIGNSNIEIVVIRNHILLRKPGVIDKNIIVAQKDSAVLSNSYVTLDGEIYDRISNEPIAFCAVGVNNSTIGVVSNQDGEFRLTLPDSLVRNKIKLSHVGYQSEEIEASLLVGQKVRISLEPKIIPLQEIVVRAVDPLSVLKEMLIARERNYSLSPVNITTFYREGIEHKNKVIDVTEAILKVYKTGIEQEFSIDQVKLIKKRRIISKQKSDTIFTKIKSGINTCLALDLMKNLPDFIERQSDTESPYVYRHTDISMIDNRRVNVISFEQKTYIDAPLYKGELFVDAENFALLEARFEINPKYVEKATAAYVERKSKELNLILQKAQYIVSYKQNNGVYYINHIRGDIDFKVKKKRRLFSTPLHLWFEMVSCEISTENVKGFSRRERISTMDIFSDTNYTYDRDFWGNFNIILPEEPLENVIINNINQVVDSQLKD